MKKKSIVSIVFLSILAFSLISLLTFFLLENRKRNILKEQIAFSESFYKFSNNEKDFDLNFALNDAKNMHYENVGRDLALLSYYKFSLKEKEYASLIVNIVENTSYSNLVRSLARLYFVSFILNKGYTEFLSYEDKGLEYLNYFQNQQQVYFNFSLFLKILFHIKKQDLVSAKAYAQKLLAQEDVNDFIKEQTKIILTKMNNENR
ncbi:MAG: hypothetical protein ISN64_03680 [Rickettsia sp.]|nr:hypothetical protein [Rickettsia sp.]